MFYVDYNLLVFVNSIQPILFAFSLLSTPSICQASLGITAAAPAGDSHADLQLSGHLGISCMPPTAPDSSCSNRPLANYGFPRSPSSRNHYEISHWNEMFSFAPLHCSLVTWGFNIKQENKLSTKTQSTKTMKIEYVSPNKKINK